MADDKAVAAISGRAVKMRRRFKAARRELQSTRGDATGTLRSALELQAAVSQVKPPPKADAKLQEVLAKSGKLQDLARFQDTLQRYTESRDDLEMQFSRAGQKRLLLNGLIKMAETSVQQHTGGNDQGFNRRSAREVFTALKALQADQKQLQKTGKKAMPKWKAPATLAPDAPVKHLDEVVAALRADDKHLKKAQTVFKKNTVTTEEHVDELVEALSGAES